MCTRCVRFTREITETGELIVDGRGAHEQIDVFPGVALDNELSANVIDICPVGALLDKDFLFQQRVWFLHKTPSIDGITASGDNISVEHNNGQVFRIKPRENQEVNRHWITDEVRYGWKFVHDDARLDVPQIKGDDPYDPTEAPVAYDAAYDLITEKLRDAKKIGLMVSPMLSCEDAYLLALYVSQFDAEVQFGIGPVPFEGEDKTFADGFVMRAEKAPNARGVKRVLEKFTSRVRDFDEMRSVVADDSVDAIVLTGNYPSDWVTPEFTSAVAGAGDRFTVLIDTLPTAIAEHADVVLPGATWVEKAGTFENVNNRLQAFERAIDPRDYSKSEAQIALDLIARQHAGHPARFNPVETRQRMASEHGLGEFVTDVHPPSTGRMVESDMQLIEL
jgi:NADH-quinone oxidoreductase subunit G